jgi:hypothetical protein
VASPDRVQVEDSCGSHGTLSSLQAPGSALQRLDVRLRMHPGGFFFFGSPCTIRDFIAVTSSPCFDMTSSLPLRLHVDQGLVRHGYPWVPTDQGPRGSCQVDPTCQKTSRPASGPGELIRSPGELGRPQTTLSRLRATCQACGASLPLDHGGGATSRPEDRGILSVITEDDLPKSVTDPDEGPPTSNGNPSLPPYKAA